eukprot:TRINITY_DN1034_c0_g4_i2.p2 TRINITY_DN1034_c0_g4~~TRINITY_DN1034_c0_g4_i2.p2  ORF type:complete len:168 (+),score=50.67 TRINITY_DN1034_c0_g4_i2:73-576(+)
MCIRDRSLTFAEKRVTLVAKEKEAAKNFLAKMRYVKNLDIEIATAEIDGKFTVTISHSKPPLDVKSLDVLLWSIGSQGDLIDPPTFEMLADKTKLYFRAMFKPSELTPQYGCHDVNDDPNYTSKACKMQLSYFCTNQGRAVKVLDFMMTVRTPKSSGHSFIVVNKLN